MSLREFSPIKGGFVFESAICARPKCNRIIRGPSYKCLTSGCSERSFCETCFLRGKVFCLEQNHRYGKFYKHCILPEVVTPSRSFELCHCKIPGIGRGPQSKSLFPVDRGLKHSRSNPKCGLLKLRKSLHHARAKSLKEPLRLSQEKKPNKLQKQGSRSFAALRAKRQSLKEGILPDWDDELETLKAVESSESSSDSLPELETAIREHERSKTIEGRGKFQVGSPQLSSDTIRQHGKDSKISNRMAAAVKKYPFGNVHVSLMVGPLLIENGAQQEYVRSHDPIHTSGLH